MSNSSLPRPAGNLAYAEQAIPPGAGRDAPKRPVPTKGDLEVIRDDDGLRHAVTVLDDLLRMVKTESCTLCGVLSPEQIDALHTLRRVITGELSPETGGAA